jgi:intein/homing endonuclease
MNTIDVTDAQIAYAAENSRSAAEAARMLGINYKTYREHAIRIGVFKTNQGLKGYTGKEKCPEKDFRKHKVNDNIFKTINADTAYWLGFIASDGSVVDNSLRFVLNARDRETLQRFLEFTESDYEVHDHTASYTDSNGIKHEFDAVNIKIISDEIVNDLAKFGIVQGKKYKDIPFINYIPYEYRIDFMIGFFDGDGSVSVSPNAITIASNYSNAEGIQEILRGIGIEYSVSSRDSIRIIYIHSKESFTKFRQLYITKNKQYGVMQRKYNKFIESIK